MSSPAICNGVLIPVVLVTLVLIHPSAWLVDVYHLVAMAWPCAEVVATPSSRAWVVAFGESSIERGSGVSNPPGAGNDKPGDSRSGKLITASGVGVGWAGMVNNGCGIAVGQGVGVVVYGVTVGKDWVVGVALGVRVTLGVRLGVGDGAPSGVSLGVGVMLAVGVGAGVGVMWPGMLHMGGAAPAES